MGKVNYAAIDIGSNAARLLIKSIDEEAEAPFFTKEQLVRVPLRLGEDSFSTGSISPEKGKQLLRLIKAYRQLMKIYDVKEYRACATSAMRDAENGEELVKSIYKKTGIRIEIINGEEEARVEAEGPGGVEGGGWQGRGSAAVRGARAGREEGEPEEATEGREQGGMSSWARNGGYRL